MTLTRDELQEKLRALTRVSNSTLVTGIQVGRLAWRLQTRIKREAIEDGSEDGPSIKRKKRESVIIDLMKD